MVAQALTAVLIQIDWLGLAGQAVDRTTMVLVVKVAMALLVLVAVVVVLEQLAAVVVQVDQAW